MTTTPTRPTAVPYIEHLPRLELHGSTDIQGNVLAAFNKDFDEQFSRARRVVGRDPPITTVRCGSPSPSRAS
ncbi:hypothetical protein ACFYNZ_20630 [Streptomyces kebangsaanensis]|uniref:Uncharacterized protein n=1 Tax=Streptomyces kebangsaanensis TaxID=864058 RepID=A0ABW6KVH1_9ACTN